MNKGESAKEDKEMSEVVKATKKRSTKDLKRSESKPLQKARIKPGVQ